MWIRRDLGAVAVLAFVIALLSLDGFATWFFLPELIGFVGLAAFIALAACLVVSVGLRRFLLDASARIIAGGPRRGVALARPWGRR